MAVIRIQTLRNAWENRGFGREIDGHRPDLQLYALETTVGELRKQAKPSEVDQQELGRKRVRKTREPRPAGFKFGDHIKYLQWVCLGDLPEISYRRLWWYEHPWCCKLFDNASETGKAGQNPVWDLVFEGDFSEHFRADDMLVAVQL
ncbi:hypothetical protein GNI_186900 [Gregarina niphandrodes]|uniref:Uncharacterized protein n=1 Tax=Gregarina niphandrodes TaxID=110365 RepID=A0A023AXV4_GRENI|nr:hypothetical protein GNI_186900 [Gregarina niphandrodes]EZG43115.1 hypothetical protein GNI_186900 [Gregarina niphandrodes]|eukprot:XP_011133627.1 hypothetical protein GNI_186900 [Gregarina niphandrodes]